MYQKDSIASTIFDVHFNNPPGKESQLAIKDDIAKLGFLNDCVIYVDVNCMFLVYDRNLRLVEKAWFVAELVLVNLCI